MRQIVSLLVLFLVFESCAIQHKKPLNQTPNEITNDVTFKAFVDQNGSFYPDNWLEDYGPHPKNSKRYAYSLHTIAERDGLDEQLSAFEASVLNKIAAQTASKKRVFILVHGYNNGESGAANAYSIIREQIDYQQTDYFIDFHWDGMFSKKSMGSMKIWFNAAGFSQLAGVYGLRKILNTIENKEVIIISHSRGASVVLSAFSNPPYSEGFRNKTEKELGLSVWNDEVLAENDNEIRCIFLAPAVGYVDFKTPNYYDGDNSYRQFSDQLKQVYVTINRDDPTLRKVFGFTADNFNPTDLGYNQRVFDQLQSHYKIFEQKNFSGMESHAFKRYLDNPLFKVILREMGIATR